MTDDHATGDGDGTIRALIIEPGRQPRHTRIGNTLDTLQRLVGGWVEPVGFDDGTVCWVNEEGKMHPGWVPNRALRVGVDGTFPSREGRVVDVVAGTMVLTGMDADTGMNTGLTGRAADMYARLFAL